MGSYWPAWPGEGQQGQGAPREPLLPEGQRKVAVVTSMLVAFSFSSITCFRMTREDLIASFSVMDCKTNHS